MKIRPLRKDLADYLATHNLTAKYQKTSKLLQQNIKHPSLNTELLEPKKHGIYSFRIDLKYRALFFIDGSEIEVFKVTNHYRK